MTGRHKRIDRAAVVEALRDCSLTYPEIAARFGIGIPTLHRIGSANGFTSRRRGVVPRNVDKFVGGKPRYTERDAGFSTPCWIWNGTFNQYGYGIWRLHRQRHYAHRMMYQVHVGLIPDGLTIDHLCFNTLCVNPAHMEPVSLSENTRRARARRRHQCELGASA